MPNFETLLLRIGDYGPIILFTVAVFLGAEAIFMAVSRRRRHQGQINERLRILARTDDRQAALVELRRSRGLTAEGSYRLPLIAFNRLVLQSGIRLHFGQLAVIAAGSAIVSGLVTMNWAGAWPIAVLVALAFGVLGPIVVLTVLRARRRSRFETQLPESIDVMVRSLRAGHPIPVAIAMVARELPDPVGSEFGIAGDEMTYGLDLGTAMSNLQNRVGQMDLSMLVVAISIQSTTGGNLAEILGNLSRLIRDRSKMRRKIKALSAEGRFSAIALSLIPLIVAGLINLTSPNFYGEVRNDPIFMPVVYFGMALWLTGTVVMRRMVNFRI